MLENPTRPSLANRLDWVWYWSLYYASWQSSTGALFFVWFSMSVGIHFKKLSSNNQAHHTFLLTEFLILLVHGGVFTWSGWYSVIFEFLLKTSSYNEMDLTEESFSSISETSSVAILSALRSCLKLIKTKDQVILKLFTFAQTKWLRSILKGKKKVFVVSHQSSLW